MDPPDTRLCQLDWNRGSAETQWNLSSSSYCHLPPEMLRQETASRKEVTKKEEMKHNTYACTFILCVCVCNPLQVTSPTRTGTPACLTGIFMCICFCLSLSFTSCLPSLVFVSTLWLQQGTVIQEDIISCQH